MDSNAGFVDDLEENKYVVNYHMQVVALLSAMYFKKSPLLMSIPGSSNTSLTIMLDINEDTGSVILDIMSNDPTTDRILRNGAVTIEGVLDSIKIRFVSNRVESCEYKGSPAVKIEIPKTLLRMQRRDFFRVPIPFVHPVICEIPAAPETNDEKLMLAINNISLGGLVLMDSQLKIGKSIGSGYKDCSITLPGLNVITSDIIVRNRQTFMQSNGLLAALVGLEFKNLSRRSINALQAYINTIELDLRSLKMNDDSGQCSTVKDSDLKNGLTRRNTDTKEF
jgi:c-di-GMP-binding flagellar brake protein YcgR